MFDKSMYYKRGAVLHSERLLNILLLFNILFMTGSCLIVGSGAYLIHEHLDFVPDVLGTGIAFYATSVLVFAGCVLFVASIFGVIGSMSKRKHILYLYAGLLTASFIPFVVSASMAITFRSWAAGPHLERYMSNVLKYQYGVESYERLTKHWNRAQAKWYCCGALDNGWGVYRASTWYLQNQTNLQDQTGPYVPSSCCLMDQYGDYMNLQKCTHYRLGPPGIQSGLSNNYIFSKGCYTAGWYFVHSIAGYLLLLTVLPATLSILLINLALFVSCAL